MGAEKLDHPYPGLEINSLTRLRREVSMKVSEDRIEVDLNGDILQGLMGHILDRHAHGITRCNRGRSLTLRIEYGYGNDLCRP